MKVEGQLTRVELAKALGCNPRTVAKWQEEGLPVAARGLGGRASRYDEAEVRAWLAAREEAARRPDQPLDLAVERARKEHWQALLAEQTHQIREGKLLPIDEVVKQTSARIAASRAVLLAIPTACAPKIMRAATLGGEAEVERVLAAEIHRALLELSGDKAAQSEVA